MISKSIRKLKAQSWPRLQLIYFLIAAGNIITTLCGLYLGYQVVTAFKDSVRQNSHYEDQRERIESVMFQSVDAQSSLIDGVINKNVSDASKSFEKPIKSFNEANESWQAHGYEFYDPAALKRVDELKQQIVEQFQIMSLKAAAAEKHVKKSETIAALQQLVAINEIYSALRINGSELMEILDKERVFLSQKTQSEVNKIQFYQLLVGMLMAVVVCLGAYYGYALGRLLKKKFTELEKTHSALADSHEQAIAFSREIQIVNQDMGKLNRQLHDNLTALREAQDEALRKGKMAQLGNLTATVAHELRNPLSTVRTSVFLLGRKVRGRGLDVEAQLQRINNGVIRCDNIITQLLDFSRSKPTALEPVALDAWLEKLLQSEALRLPEIINIECYFGLNQQLVEIEPNRFERAIINLLSNASEAMVGKGDDPKQHQTSRPTICIETKLTDRGVEISVSDNGPGISPRNLAKVREPLFTTKNFGTGLGIPAVQQILEQHSGSLDISSVEGEGAIFTLCIPLTAQSSQDNSPDRVALKSNSAI